jgi:rod shape-determining protein MreC
VALNRARRRSITFGLVGFVIAVSLYLSGGVVAGLRSAANFVVTPFSVTVNFVARPVGHLLAGAINYSDVVAQNQRLRYELGLANERANATWGESRSLAEISTSLNVPFAAGLTQVAAQVTSLSPTNFVATVDIDKGRDDGVLAGEPVVANGGLVGTVSATTPHGATVRLITDVASSIGVTFGVNQPSIIVSGRGVNNGLSATSVPLNSSITPGQILSTDGLAGGLYPVGLPVARVRTETLTPGAATYDLTLEPTADLRHLTYVDVLLWEPAS